MSWDLKQFEEATTAALAALSRYVGECERGERPAIVRRPPAEIAERLDLRRWIKDGGMEPATFATFLDAYLHYATALHHPHYLAHQVAVPDFPAALADFIHGAVNNPMAMYEMGPPGATIELVITEWMMEKLGWDVQAGAGVLTHGGSLANLTALLVARARVAPEAWTAGVSPDLAVLAPEASHYSVKRAVAILGMGEQAVVRVPSDGLGRIAPARLAEVIERERGQGRRLMALIANACATTTGLHDDLAAIAEVCRAHDLWLHVDAAHGGGALLSPAHRHLLRGIEHADSVVWDAHKMLRTSSLCAAVLVRRRADFAAAFRQEASYIFYGDHEGIDFIKRTIECTKAALGVKVFLNLAWRGEAGLGAYVAEQYDKTRRFYDLIRQRPGFECPYPPESNILCFRYGTSDAQQIALRDALARDGTFHLSAAELDGKRYLRITVMAPATDEPAIARLLDTLERLAH